MMAEMSKADTVKKDTYPKVLVIDIERDRAREVTGYLRDHGFQAVACFSPRGAMGRIRRERPDALVVEVIMAGGSGFEIAARIQADSRLSRIPIIFTTDIQNSGDENRDYFPRPFDMSRLLLALRQRIAAGA